MQNSYTLSQIDAYSYERKNAFTQKCFKKYLQGMPFEDPPFFDYIALHEDKKQPTLSQNIVVYQ